MVTGNKRSYSYKCTMEQLTFGICFYFSFEQLFFNLASYIRYVTPSGTSVASSFDQLNLKDYIYSAACEV